MKEGMRHFFDWTKVKINLHNQESVIFAKEREIWWASLGVNIGFEQNGKHETFERPVLILKQFNPHLLWILPITSKEKNGKYYYPVFFNNKQSNIVLSQIRTVSSKRLLRKIAVLSTEEFVEIQKKIKEFL